MQLNKLSYISHGWNLALHDAPLILEPIEAWKYGPVIPSLYHRFKKYGANPITLIGYCNTPLDNKAASTNIRNVINAEFNSNEKQIMYTVLELHKDYDGNQLSGMTHIKGSPWHQCYVKDELYVDIPNDLIKNYFKQVGEIV